MVVVSLCIQFVAHQLLADWCRSTRDLLCDGTDNHRCESLFSRWFLLLNSLIAFLSFFADEYCV